MEGRLCWSLGWRYQWIFWRCIWWYFLNRMNHTSKDMLKGRKNKFDGLRHQNKKDSYLEKGVMDAKIGFKIIELNVRIDWENLGIGKGGTFSKALLLLMKERKVSLNMTKFNDNIINKVFESTHFNTTHFLSLKAFWTFNILQKKYSLFIGSPTNDKYCIFG